jgi:hypothetical protein
MCDSNAAGLNSATQQDADLSRVLTAIGAGASKWAIQAGIINTVHMAWHAIDIQAALCLLTAAETPACHQYNLFETVTCRGCVLLLLVLSSHCSWHAPHVMLWHGIHVAPAAAADITSL